MNDTIIAAKAKEQHDNFLGKVFTHFSKPKARFVRETTYGILAFGRLVRSIVRIAPRTEKADISQYLPGFAELLDLGDG